MSRPKVKKVNLELNISLKNIIFFIVGKPLKVTYVTETHHSPPPTQNFDYRNFLDFGYFSNAAAHFGGAHVPGDQQVIVEKTYIPSAVHDKEV